MLRQDGRDRDQLRPVRLQRGVNKYAEGSCLIEQGDTKILCTATVEERVPPFLRNTNTGWVTAEYGMLPRSAEERLGRPGNRFTTPSRHLEIQRLIGRSLRAVVDLEALGERTIILDCDVLQADGGTRTASITAAFVALTEAVEYLKKVNQLRKPTAIFDQVAAVSVGVVGGFNFLDLAYEEDARASVDMNVVMSGKKELVELQVTAEAAPFSRQRLIALLDLAEKGIDELIKAQNQILQK